MCNSVNVSKAMELYTLNGWIVWYVNYISIELFLKSGWPLYCPSRKPIKKPLPYTKNFPSSVFISSKEPRVTKHLLLLSHFSRVWLSATHQILYRQKQSVKNKKSRWGQRDTSFVRCLYCTWVQWEVGREGFKQIKKL